VLGRWTREPSGSHQVVGPGPAVGDAQGGAPRRAPSTPGVCKIVLNGRLGSARAPPGLTHLEELPSRPDQLITGDENQIE